jgi:CIC family chloride channel protein
LLAPMFMSSAALGGVFAMAVNAIVPGAHLSPGAFALVAMAAVFGAASRATFAFIVFAFEITRDYNAVLPLMLGCVIADLIALRYLKTSIMTEKLARRGLHVPGEYEASVLHTVRLSEVMRTDVQPIAADTSVAGLAARIGKSENGLTLSQGLPIADKDGLLAGVITQGNMLRALEADPEGHETVLEAGSAPPIVAYSDEFVHDALHRMVSHNVGRLPVVSREDPRRMIGYFDRSNLLNAWTRRIEEEGVREHGWIARWKGSK